MSNKIQAKAGQTVSFQIQSSGESTVVQIVGDDIRGVLVQTAPVSYIGGDVELRGCLDGAAGDNPAAAEYKTLEPDVKDGNMYDVSPVNFLWFRPAVYSSGKIKVWIKPY